VVGPDATVALLGELMGALANCRLPGDAKDRLRRVVLHRVMNPEPRLGRPVGQLATMSGMSPSRLRSEPSPSTGPWVSET
jgi:hypothetical protein